MGVRLVHGLRPARPVDAPDRLDAPGTIAPAGAALAAVALRAALISIVAGLVLAAGADAATYRIRIRDDGFVVRLGPWKVQSRPALAAGKAALGEPSSVQPGRGVCKVKWSRLGLTTTFTSFGGISDFCNDGSVQTGIIRSRRFKTWKGLRVGMRSSRVPELHPDAEFERGKWVLASQTVFGTEPAPTVSALVRDGRVRSLTLWIGGAGD